MVKRLLAVVVASIALAGVLAGPSQAVGINGPGYSCTSSTGYTYWIRGTAKGLVEHSIWSKPIWVKGTFSVLTYRTTNTNTQVSQYGGWIYWPDPGS